MFQNGRCEICEDVEAAPDFTDTPFPHCHKKRPFGHECKQGKKRAKHNARGHCTDLLQYRQLLSIWSNCSFKLVSLFFSDTALYIWVEKTLSESCHWTLWSYFVLHIYAWSHKLPRGHTHACFEAAQLAVNRFFLWFLQHTKRQWA